MTQAMASGDLRQRILIRENPDGSGADVAVLILDCDLREHKLIGKLRDGSLTDIATGAVSHDVYGETFPDKNFPDTNTTKIGVYVQDEIEIGRLSLM